MGSFSFNPITAASIEKALERILALRRSQA